MFYEITFWHNVCSHGKYIISQDWSLKIAIFWTNFRLCSQSYRKMEVELQYSSRIWLLLTFLSVY